MRLSTMANLPLTISPSAAARNGRPLLASRPSPDVAAPTIALRFARILHGYY